MKRVISILLSVVLISNALLASTLMASATGVKSDQDTLVNYDSLVTGNYDIDSESLNDSIIGTTESVTLYPVFEKKVYKPGDDIFAQFKLTESLVGVDTTYESNGFSVSGDISSAFDPDSNCQVYNVTLTYDGAIEEPYFAIGVVTDDGTTEYAKVFGYLSDHGLFLSKCSHEDAKDASYYYLVEIGQWTMEEYRDLMRQEYSKAGITTINCIPPVDMSAVIFDQNASALAMTTSNETSSTTVSGNLNWIDDRGISHPLQYNSVEVWDSLNDERLGRVFTDASGNYSLTFTDEHAYHNIYLKISPCGERHQLNKYNNPLYENDDSFQSIDSLFECISQTASNVMPGTIVNIDWEIDMTSHVGQAFQISQAIGVAVKYVEEMHGTSISNVCVYYPYDKGCKYIRDGDENSQNFVISEIYISGLPPKDNYPNSYASWDAIMHEYGHHVEHEFGINDSPGGDHYFTWNLAEEYDDKDIGIRLAWAEAYAYVFSGMAQAYFASSLQNIDTVGDAVCEAYNSSTMDYENVLDKHRQGDACEGSIVGILWDLYDTVTESHDTISFSHSAYWDMITNSKAKTLSEFCVYFTNRYEIGMVLSLGKLLSYYKVSASGLTASTGGETPVFNWTANGVTATQINNRFDLIILDKHNSETLRINNLTSTSYTLTEEQWQSVLNSYGTTYTVVVIAHQRNNPPTGGYYSESLTVSKPTGGIVDNFPQSSWRYTEKILTLTPGCYYDLYVTFNIAGSKLIQTFGRGDTVIEMYNAATGELLVDADNVDDNGYSLIALVRYDTNPNSKRQN